MENEIFHHGTKGMKWGIRRYQNKDGSLTPAGRKRYNAEMEKLKAREKVAKNKARTQAKWDKLEEKRREIEELEGRKSTKTKPSSLTTSQTPKSKSTSSQKPRTIKDLSDDELRTLVNRLTMEQQYNRLNPKQVSKGEQFVKSTLEKVVVPAVQEVAKNALKSQLENAVKNAQKTN